MARELVLVLQMSALFLVTPLAGSMSAAQPASSPQRTARHFFVALGTIKDYSVPGASYDLLIVRSEERRVGKECRL